MARFSLDHLTWSDRQFDRFVLTCMTLAFVALVCAGGAAALVLARNQAAVRWVVHTYEVEREIFGFRLVFERAETVRRALLVRQRADFSITYDRIEALAPRAIDRIARLTRDNPRQQRMTAELRRLSARQLALTRASVTAVREGRAAAARAAFGNDGSIAAIRALRRQTDAMFAEEDRLLRLRTAEQAKLGRILTAVLSGAGLLLLTVGALSLVMIRRYTRDLGRSQIALRALNDNLEGAVAERTADLTRANEEIQRFAYIVSHDLRSPLVNVMGFTAELATATKPLAELIDRAEAEAPQILTEEARVAVREDLPEAIGFIRSSTQKMDRLIAAILKLSREGRRVIAPERLDMMALMESVRAGLAYRADAAGAQIRLHAPLPDIVSDRVAVDQVFSNLVENAVKYLKPDRPGVIDVRGRAEGARTIFEVADNGRGIDPRDHDRVFDLFRRSGVQDQPGEGIGLAHVRALVYRLGGTIACDSALDQGAVFRVTLPMVLGKEAGDAA